MKRAWIPSWDFAGSGTTSTAMYPNLHSTLFWKLTVAIPTERVFHNITDRTKNIDAVRMFQTWAFMKVQGWPRWLSGLPRSILAYQSPHFTPLNTISLLPLASGTLVSPAVITLHPVPEEYFPSATPNVDLSFPPSNKMEGTTHANQWKILKKHVDIQRSAEEIAQIVSQPNMDRWNRNSTDMDSMTSIAPFFKSDHVQIFFRMLGLGRIVPPPPSWLKL